MSPEAKLPPVSTVRVVSLPALLPRPEPIFTASVFGNPEAIRTSSPLMSKTSVAANPVTLSIDILVSLLLI